MKKPHVLLCSGWQMVNIGDIAHTPAGLALLEQYLPDADITVWEYKPLSPETRRMLAQRFPAVKIVGGSVAPDADTASNAELDAAIRSADFLLHGSGPATLAWSHAEGFHRLTGRPFGVYGVTYGLYGIPERETLSRAEFVYFRDEVSLRAAQSDGVHPPIMEFAPDVAFAFDLRGDAKAAAFLAANDLETGNFLCCIPRLRYTPFWDIPEHNAPFDPVKHERNEAMKEGDLRPLVEAIIRVVRESTMKVLICAEDATQVALGKECLFDKLPADVQKNVVWRDTFWLPDEALSVYAASAGVFGCEMHSPIMCIGNGIPAVVCRWAEQSSKGTMWKTIGLSDWLFDLDTEGESLRVPEAVLALAQNPGEAREKANRARHVVQMRHGETFAVVRQAVFAAHQARQ
ncbi:MAG: polysaccharide pyruvyl transferase family protein [Armatimonadetes bacterium]|nr:polysaccharide pyruvyl transferase family protein [Armatimonadota bacterium]